MNQTEEIVNRLRSIERSLQQQAQLASARWRAVVIVFVCGCAIAAPAVVSYVYRLLVYWF